MLTVLVLLLLAAFVTCIASAMGKCPLWISVLLVIIADLLVHLPLGK
jgi:hypothetical protein